MGVKRPFYPMDRQNVMKKISQSLFGFRFTTALDVTQVANAVIEDVRHAAGGTHDFLITPNAYQVVHFNDPENRGLMDFYCDVKYILPDGMPIVWVSKLGNDKLANRLTGSDLFPVLFAQIKLNSYPVTFILPDVKMKDLFGQDYANCNCFVPRIFAKDDDEYIALFAAVVAAGVVSNQSIFVFLGLGFPKQEILAMKISDLLKREGYSRPVLFLLLGASFEFYFGLKDRAPTWIQKTGMEWLYRFAQEPKRLWKRYTVDNLRFIILAVKALVK